MCFLSTAGRNNNTYAPYPIAVKFNRHIARRFRPVGTMNLTALTMMRRRTHIVKYSIHMTHGTRQCRDFFLLCANFKSLESNVP